MEYAFAAIRTNHFGNPSAGNITIGLDLVEVNEGQPLPFDEATSSFVAPQDGIYVLATSFRGNKGAVVSVILNYISSLHKYRVNNCISIIL